MKVELVGADDRPVGASTQTNEAGYFDLTLNAAQVEALGQEPKVYIRVTDSMGNVVHRDTEPVTIAANMKSRATVVAERQRTRPCPRRTSCRRVFSNPTTRRPSVWNPTSA